MMYDHTLNVYETTPVAGHVHVRLASHTAQPDADHHHGLIHFHDQCYAIHSLSGAVASNGFCVVGGNRGGASVLQQS